MKMLLEIEENLEHIRAKCIKQKAELDKAVEALERIVSDEDYHIGTHEIAQQALIELKGEDDGESR